MIQRVLLLTTRPVIYVGLSGLNFTPCLDPGLTAWATLCRPSRGCTASADTLSGCTASENTLFPRYDKMPLNGVFHHKPLHPNGYCVMTTLCKHMTTDAGGPSQLAGLGRASDKKLLPNRTTSSRPCGQGSASCSLRSPIPVGWATQRLRVDQQRDAVGQVFDHVLQHVAAQRLPQRTAF